MPPNGSCRTGSKSKSYSRRTWLKLSGVAASGLLAGCSQEDQDDAGETTTDGETGEADNQSETTIEFWHWPPGPDRQRAWIKDMVRRFNEGPGKEKGIRVERTAIPFGDFKTKLLSAIGAKDTPDAAYGMLPWLMDPAGKSKEEIRSKLPVVLAEDLYSEEVLDEYYEALWAQQIQTWNARVAIPFYVGGVRAFYVNQDLASEAGIEEFPTAPTIEDYHELTKAISENTGNHGHIMALKDMNHQTWRELPRSHGKLVGGGYQNQDNEFELTLADSAYRDMWDDLYVTPLKNGWMADPLAYKGLEHIQDFYEGGFGSIQGPTWYRLNFNKEADFEWSSHKPPQPADAEPYIHPVAGAPALTFKEEYGGNPEAAKEFVKHWTSKEEAADFAARTATFMPNKHGIEQVKEMYPDNTSEFFNDTNGMAAVEQLEKSLKKTLEVPKMLQNRYPSIHSSSYGNGDYLSVKQGVPPTAGGGQITEKHRTELSNMLLQAKKGDDVNIEDTLSSIEKQWQQILETAGHKVNGETTEFDTPGPA